MPSCAGVCRAAAAREIFAPKPPVRRPVRARVEQRPRPRGGRGVLFLVSSKLTTRPECRDAAHESTRVRGRGIAATHSYTAVPKFPTTGCEAAPTEAAVLPAFILSPAPHATVSQARLATAFRARLGVRGGAFTPLQSMSSTVKSVGSSARDASPSSCSSASLSTSVSPSSRSTAHL